MQNRNSLLHLIDRAERGSLLPGEAQILREAIERLDELAMICDTTMSWPVQDYEASTTQTFRAVTVDDDDAPGRP